jgi:integrase
VEFTVPVIDPTQTVKEFATATLRDRLIRESTSRSYMQTLWLLRLDHLPMSEISLAQLYRSLADITNMNSRRKHIVALRAVFRDVVPNLRELKIPKALAKVYQLPTEAELRFTLMMSPQEFQGLLMMYAGLRVGEACAITPKDIEGNVLHVHKQRDANGRLVMSKTQGQVVVPDWLADRIRTTKHHPVTPGAVRESFRRYGEKTGVPIMCHMLRHWYCTEMVNHRINPEIARQQMRHSDLKTTLGYYAQIKKSDIDQVVFDIFNGDGSPSKPKAEAKCFICSHSDKTLKLITTAAGDQFYACVTCIPQPGSL